MQKSRKVYSYPFYDALSDAILNEIIFYDFLKKFYELLNEEVEVNFITSSLPSEDMERLKNLAPYANIFSAEDYMKEIDVAIKNLYQKNRLRVQNRIRYYCEECDEYFRGDEIETVEKEVKEDIIRVRIGKKLYFIGSIPSDEQPIGISLYKDDTILLVDLDNEIWIAPKSLMKILLYNIEIPPQKINEVKVSTLKNLEKYVIIGEHSTGFIKKGDKLSIKIKKKIPSYTTIYSITKTLPINVCPRCGSVLKKINTPFLIVEHDDKVYSITSTEGSYKLPLLYCNNCGHLEYGKKLKSCPECGNIMERKFYLHPYLNAIGIYLTEFKFKSPILILHEKRRNIKESLEGVLAVLGYRLFTNTHYVHHILPEEMDEIRRCVILSKTRGGTNEAGERKIRKLENTVRNIVRYVEIYGSTENLDDVDEWLEWKNEIVKKEYRELIEKWKFAEAFDMLYNHILLNISRFYIPFKKKDPLVIGPIVDALKMLYPYLPSLSKEMLNKLNVDDLLLEFRKPKEIRNVGVARELLHTLKKYRNKRGIPFREPLKKVVFVSEYADELRPLIPQILRKENIMVFNSVTVWDEMEVEVEPNIEEIGTMYRAWAPKIAFLLRRKNVKEIMSAMEKGGYTLGVEGFIIKITPKMVRYIKKIPEGYEKLENAYGEVYIYTERDLSTERLRLVNEVIRRINFMRKDIEMDFDDMIDISISGDEEALRMLRGYDDEIKERCLARNIDFRYIDYGYIVEWPIMGYKITIGINPLFKKWVIKAFSSIPGVDKSQAELLFKMGFGSIYELMEASPEEISEITGLPINLTRDMREYLYSTAFKSLKENKKEYCPFCRAEISPTDDFCPYCGAPIRVKIEKEEIKRGNVYLLIGEFSRLMRNMPEEIGNSKKLLVTKDNPEEVKKDYNLKNTDTIWISYVPLGRSIKPKELEKLLSEIEKFLNKGGKVILMDCVDLLLAINGLDGVLNFLRDVRELVKEKDAFIFFNVEELESAELGKMMKYVDVELK